MTDQKLSYMEKLFAALADKTRLRLLNLMRQEEVCVCFFTEVLGESQPKISRHLAYLRKSGLVEARREGKWMHYRIVRPGNEDAQTVLDAVLAWLAEDIEMDKEYQELVAVCCALDAPVTIAKAPKPEKIVELGTDSEEQSETEEIETYLL